jgi:AhpD family alkylhydroperoxidase
MDDPMYPHVTAELSRGRRDLTPNQQAALEAFGKAVFAEGALPSKIKQIIAVAVAQCPYCIKGQTKAELRAGATPHEIMRPSGWPRRCASAAPMRIRT